MLFSILFLFFMFGIPVAMIAAIIVLVRKRRSAVNGVIRLAQSKGWTFIKSGADHRLNNILEKGVFPIKKGRHTLSNIVELGPDFLICDYHYISTGTAKHRRSSNSTLAVVRRENNGPDFRIIRRYDGPLGTLAEAAGMGQVQPLSEEAWSWALTSSEEAFEKAGWIEPVPRILKKRMVPGGGLFLSGKYLILSKPGVLDEGRVLQLKEDAEMIRNLI